MRVPFTYVDEGEYVDKEGAVDGPLEPKHPNPGKDRHPRDKGRDAGVVLDSCRATFASTASLFPRG